MDQGEKKPIDPDQETKEPNLITKLRERGYVQEAERLETHYLAGNRAKQQRKAKRKAQRRSRRRSR